jgi:hypothetical protein
VTEWTEQMIARLRDMHEAGASFSEIGNALGVSRSAAIGKASRMGLRVRRATVLARPAIDKRQNTRADGTYFRKGGLKGNVSAPNFYDLSPERSPRATSLLNLKPSQCRWPVTGEARGFDAVMFCGVEAQSGCSYCGQHRMRSIARSAAA